MPVSQSRSSGVLSFGTVSTATNLVVTDESSDSTCFPLFTTLATGTLPPKTGTNLSFNSSSGLLTATGFSGSGASLTSLNASNISSGTIAAARVATLNQNTTGSAATLTTARTIGGVSFDGSANIDLPGVNTAGNQNTSGTAAVATNISVGNESSDTTCFPVFTTGATGSLPPKTVSSLTFNSSNGTLAATTFSGSGASLTNLSASNLSSGTIPDARFPATLPAISGANLTNLPAGATGGGSDEIFYLNDQTVTSDFTIPNGKNAGSFGPITIASGVTVTVGSGETLTIV